MPFKEDISVFFEEKDFATEIRVTLSLDANRVYTTFAIFEEPTALENFGNYVITSTNPSLLMAHTDDTALIEHGDTVEISEDVLVFTGQYFTRHPTTLPTFSSFAINLANSDLRPYFVTINAASTTQQLSLTNHVFEEDEVIAFRNAQRRTIATGIVFSATAPFPDTEDFAHLFDMNLKALYPEENTSGEQITDLAEVFSNAQDYTMHSLNDPVTYVADHSPIHDGTGVTRLQITDLTTQDREGVDIPDPFDI